jgi:hypothetical protein
VPGLSIPKGDRLGLAILREMPEEVFQSLLLEIDRSPGSIPTVKNLSPEDASLVMEAVNTMYRVRTYAEVSVEEFISDVCEVLLEHKELRTDQVRPFRERLEKVLDIEALNVAAKAVTLVGEHERLFCSVRIITDARPIYGQSVIEQPVALAITHIMKIDYHGSGGHLQEIYIGLGSRDIEELIEALNRARDKATSLQAALEPSKIKFIDPQQS